MADPTTHIFVLMLITMGCVTMLVPRLQPRIRRGAPAVSFVPTLVLFAYGSHLASLGRGLAEIQEISSKK